MNHIRHIRVNGSKNLNSEMDQNSISFECIYHIRHIRLITPYVLNVPACRFTCRRHGRQGSKIISNKSLIATRKLVMLVHNSQISLMNTDFKIHICENLVHFDLQTHYSLRRRRRGTTHHFIKFASCNLSKQQKDIRSLAIGSWKRIFILFVSKRRPGNIF